jgi:hypothetical protein
LFPVSSLSPSPSFSSCSVFLAAKTSPNAELNPGTTYPVLHKISRTSCISHPTFGPCVTVSRLITGIFRKEEWKIALKIGYIYSQNTFSINFQTLNFHLLQMKIYCCKQCTAGTTVHRVAKYFLLHFVKYPPYRKNGSINSQS